jgi:hypothetical protein
MSTTDMDLAYDNHVYRRPGHRTREHEDSSHVMRAVMMWLSRS